MWLFTRYGFYSIACAQKQEGSIDPALLMIRSRLRSHLENLQARFPALAGREVVRLRGHDYRWRMFVPKDQWLPVLGELGREQEWSNFKHESEKYQGPRGSRYVDALHDVWRIMNDLQRTEAEA